MAHGRHRQVFWAFPEIVERKRSSALEGNQLLTPTWVHVDRVGSFMAASPDSTLPNTGSRSCWCSALACVSVSLFPTECRFSSVSHPARHADRPWRHSDSVKQSWRGSRLRPASAGSRRAHLQSIRLDKALLDVSCTPRCDPAPLVQRLASTQTDPPLQAPPGASKRGSGSPPSLQFK